MRSPSLLNIIKFIAALFCVNTLSAQDQRMQRLALQYLSFQNTEERKNDSLLLLTSNAYLNEGNYEKAVFTNEKVKESARNRSMKLFVAGKAEFLKDNYEGSLSFFDALNVEELDQLYKRETILFKVLNYNHLMDPQRAYRELGNAIILNGHDTTGLAQQYFSFSLPKLINVRKVKRRSSLLPGSGLYYAGEKSKAFGSFFMNLLCLGYTGYSIYTQHYITSAFTGLAQFMRFYNGGKRAGVKFAVKRNREAYLKYVLDVDSFAQKKYFDSLN